jgi:hypothetical protein
VKAVVNNARTRFANGKRQAAIRLLEEFQPASHPDIAAALTELRAALQKIEEERRIEQERIARQERVAALLAEAQSALRDSRFDAALERIAAAEEIDPASAELVPLRDKVHQEQAAARLSEELETRLAEVRERLTADDLSAAGELLDAAAALAPVDPRVQTVRQQIAQAVAAREAAEARARDLDAKYAGAVALFEQGDLAGSLRMLRLAQTLDDRQVRTAQLSKLSDRNASDTATGSEEAQETPPGGRRPSGVAAARLRPPSIRQVIWRWRSGRSTRHWPSNRIMRRESPEGDGASAVAANGPRSFAPPFETRPPANGKHWRRFSCSKSSTPRQIRWSPRR